ncbi:hypothetical protein BGZ94_009710, partial [Podila epigama]
MNILQRRDDACSTTACSSQLSAPDAYLFEFKSPPGDVIGAEKEKAQFTALAKTMSSVHIRQSFGLLLNGISAQITDPGELSQLMDLDFLKIVTPLTVVSPPEQVTPTTNALVTSALNMTGATRVQEEMGLTGKGVKVGIIDTGVDYTHPALGGCFGPGCKVAVGWDFVGDAFSGKNTPVPSDNPMDCTGHGTHVAGIVGAKNDLVQGVAPQVTLGAYRVMGCNGSSTNDVILAALERAVADKMDVINLSIGEPNGWPGNPIARALDAALSFGVMIAVAQGNENIEGLFSTNYIGVSTSTLTVASMVNTRSSIPYFVTPLEPNRRIVYGTTTTDSGFRLDMPLVAAVNGTALGDGCSSLRSPDIKGKILMVTRGNCLFADKAKNALDQ